MQLWFKKVTACSCGHHCHVLSVSKFAKNKNQDTCFNLLILPFGQVPWIIELGVRVLHMSNVHRYSSNEVL